MRSLDCRRGSADTDAAVDGSGANVGCGSAFDARDADVGDGGCEAPCGFCCDGGDDGAELQPLWWRLLATAGSDIAGSTDAAFPTDCSAGSAASDSPAEDRRLRRSDSGLVRVTDALFRVPDADGEPRWPAVGGVLKRARAWSNFTKRALTSGVWRRDDEPVAVADTGCPSCLVPSGRSAVEVRARGPPSPPSESRSEPATRSAPTGGSSTGPLTLPVSAAAATAVSAAVLAIFSAIAGAAEGQSVGWPAGCAAHSEARASTGPASARLVVGRGGRRTSRVALSSSNVRACVSACVS